MSIAFVASFPDCWVSRKPPMRWAFDGYLARTGRRSKAQHRGALGVDASSFG